MQGSTDTIENFQLTEQTVEGQRELCSISSSGAADGWKVYLVMKEIKKTQNLEGQGMCIRKNSGSLINQSGLGTPDR